MELGPGGWVGGFVVGLASNIGFAGLALVQVKARHAIERARPWARFLVVLAPSLLVVASAQLAHLYWHEYFEPVLVVGVCLLFLMHAWEHHRFSRIGVAGADRTIASGIGFEDSLKMCRESMEFLGVGAHKLTQLSEFSAAVERCQRPHRPIKFLLSDPENNQLEQIARQAGRPVEEYRENVKQSLRAIARLRKERAFNIEVRVYDELPVFRLMFIDDDLCLASHYVFGKGDGSAQPQLHLRRKVSGREEESIYYAMRTYFDTHWSRARKWNLTAEV